MTECARCGACCAEIPLVATRATMLAIVAKPEPIEEGVERRAWLSSRFILEHWHKIGGVGKNTRFTCDAFDAETRLCTAHDDRPPVCSGYPWYGREPDGTAINSKFLRCSFWADVPRAKWPLGVDPLPSPVTMSRRGVA